MSISKPLIYFFYYENRLHLLCIYFLYKSNLNPYGSCEISNLDYIEV